MVGVEKMAPGCFAAASVYSMDSAVCQACCAFKECGDASLATLQAIRNTIDVRDLLNRHSAARQKAAVSRPIRTEPIEKSPVPVAQPKLNKQIERKTPMERVKFAITPDVQAIIARIEATNKKAADQAAVLCKMNRINDMRSTLPKRINPFAAGGPSYLRVTCDALLNGGFTRASLKQKLVQELSWTEGTAASHVTMAIAVLGAFRIIGKAEGSSGEKLVLHPALR